MTKTEERVLVNFRIDERDRRMLRNAAKVRGTTMADLFRSEMLPIARRIVLGEENEDLSDQAA